MTSTLTHYGVLGMHWGHRKSQEMSDQELAKGTRRIKLENAYNRGSVRRILSGKYKRMSDSELKKGADRLDLQAAFKNAAKWRHLLKNAGKMSDQDLKLAIAKVSAKRELRRGQKLTRKMSTAEIDKRVKRMMAEQRYDQMRKSQVTQGKLAAVLVISVIGSTPVGAFA